MDVLDRTAPIHQTHSQRVDTQRQWRLQKLNHRRNDDGCSAFVLKEYVYDVLKHWSRPPSDRPSLRPVSLSESLSYAHSPTRWTWCTCLPPGSTVLGMLGACRISAYSLIDVPSGSKCALASSDLVRYDMGRPISIPTSAGRPNYCAYCACLYHRAPPC